MQNASLGKGADQLTARRPEPARAEAKKIAVFSLAGDSGVVQALQSLSQPLTHRIVSPEPDELEGFLEPIRDEAVSGETYELVILVDVIDRLRNPARFLRTLASHLADHATVVAVSRQSTAAAGHDSTQSGPRRKATDRIFAESGYNIVDASRLNRFGLKREIASVVGCFEEAFRGVIQENNLEITAAVLLRRPTTLPHIREHDEPVVTVIIVIKNGLEMLQATVHSLERATLLPYELILVDNGSTDGSRQWIGYYARVKKNVTVILNEKNLGFGPANNQGMRLARGTYLLLLNSDTQVGWQAIERMVATAQVGNIAIVGPRTNRCAGEQQVAEARYDVSDFGAFSRAWAHRLDGVYRLVQRVIGFAMLVRREVVDDIGGLDLRFSPGNFEDDDYCLRARLTGYEIAIAEDAFVHHYGGATFSREKIDYGDLISRMKTRFADKWRIPVGDNVYMVPRIPECHDEVRLREHVYEPIVSSLDAKELTEIGQKLLDEARVGQAISVLRKAVSVRNGVDERLNLAEVLRLTGRLHEALDVLLGANREALEDGEGLGPKRIPSQLATMASEIYCELGRDGIAARLRGIADGSS